MLSVIMAFLGAIPGIGSLVQYIVGKVYDSKVAIETARIGGDRDVAVATVKAAADAQSKTMAAVAGNKLLTLLVVAFAIPLVAYEWRIIVHDIMWCAGQCSTDPIRGQVADWATTIISFIFGAPTALALGKMWFARK